MARLAPLAVTMGDPAGIGPELVAKAGLPPFYWLGDAATITALADVPVARIDAPAAAAAAFANALPVLALPLAVMATPGQPDAANAPAVLAAIEQAVAQARAGAAAAVITAPVAKHVLYQAGMTHPGQTELLAHLCGLAAEDVAMMLAAPALKVVPLTIHEPLRAVPDLISRDLIVRRARIVHRALQRDFGLTAPRLAITGLNPHAGEKGTLGREEIDVIVPAVAALVAEGVTVSGPHAADSLFHAQARAGYDVALTMYHDQALIALKTLDFHGGVNCSLGLPIIRTSPDHGTAFDIAGQGRANPASFIAALSLAGKMAAARLRHDG